jgi:hypothetical protein
MRAMLAAFVLCASVGVYAFSVEPAGTQSAAGQAASPKPPASRPTAPKPPDPSRLPPLPDPGYAPVRPLAEVRAAYQFAALRPEVMAYVPCFCGCERSGHRDNEDCFIAARTADGSVTWSDHGFGCAICIDVARDAMRMHNSGASVSAIRTAIEQRYRPSSHSMTPTPAPPTTKGPAGR